MGIRGYGKGPYVILLSDRFFDFEQDTVLSGILYL